MSQENIARKAGYFTSRSLLERSVLSKTANGVPVHEALDENTDATEKTIREFVAGATGHTYKAAEDLHELDEEKLEILDFVLGQPNICGADLNYGRPENRQTPGVNDFPTPKQLGTRLRASAIKTLGKLYKKQSKLKRVSSASAAWAAALPATLKTEGYPSKQITSTSTSAPGVMSEDIAEALRDTAPGREPEWGKLTPKAHKAVQRKDDFDALTRSTRIRDIADALESEDRKFGGALRTTLQLSEKGIRSMTSNSGALTNKTQHQAFIAELGIRLSRYAWETLISAQDESYLRLSSPFVECTEKLLRGDTKPLVFMATVAQETPNKKSVLISQEERDLALVHEDLFIPCLFEPVYNAILDRLLDMLVMLQRGLPKQWSTLLNSKVDDTKFSVRSCILYNATVLTRATSQFQAAVESGPAALVSLGSELKINTKQALDVQRWQSSETVFADQKLTFASLGRNAVALLTLCSTELANTAGVNDGNIHTSRDRCHDITAIIATMEKGSPKGTDPEAPMPAPEKKEEDEPPTTGGNVQVRPFPFLSRH